jgi:type VI secretion system protein ImpH
MTGVAAEERRRMETSTIVERLFRDGPHFGFFQAVWLLENFFSDAPAPGEQVEATNERVRIRPYEADVFPPSDVKSVEWTESDVAQVTVTFMGLYGVDAPLPTYFYKNIALGGEEALALRDFLDIFNHRLYAYFYRTWKKYRAHLIFERNYQNEHAERFISLAGLGTPGALAESPLPALRLSAFAGRLGNWTRNAEGFRELLSGLLEDISVTVEENIPRWVPIRERAALGSSGSSSAVLGVNSVIGERLFDVSGKFRIVLGPLTFGQYRAFLPGYEKAGMVDWLVRMYAPDFLDYDVELLLTVDEVPPVKLGAPDIHLGINTWVGKPAGDVVSDVVVYE